MRTNAQTPAKVIEKSAKFLAPRFAPLRSLPFGSQFIAKCGDCGLERKESVSRLIEQGRMGHMTAELVALGMTCRRMGCGGSVEGDIDLGD